MNAPQMPPFVWSDFLDAVLLWVAYHPLAFIVCSSVACVVAFRLAFLAGLKVTVKQESRAVQLERAKEHAARAAHLRLVAKRMRDSEVA